MSALATIDPNVLLNGHHLPPSLALDTSWKSASTPLRELSESDGELTDLFTSDSDSDNNSNASDETATGLNDEGESNAKAAAIYKGQLYDNISAAKASIGLLSLRQGGASVRVVANNTHKLIIECCEAGKARQDCPFRIYLKPVLSSEKYEVRKASDVHSCSVDGVPRRTMLNQRWFVQHIVSLAFTTLPV